MLFNSYEFIFYFLPITLIVYFLLNKYDLHSYGKAWLSLTSLYFYSHWNLIYLPLILFSICLNFFSGTYITKLPKMESKKVLIFAITANLLLLGYFKYADFFINNINSLTGSSLNLLEIVLPLGISFFTFTQIAYLVDAYKKEASEYSFVNYSLFVTFFPHLLAGPIIHHKGMMPQFADSSKTAFNKDNFYYGFLLFFAGLFKKVVIADTLATWANKGFDVSVALTLLEGWATSLSYTFQIYFDFSGYTDMALGAALMFNIKLPENFNSPYKATSIQDFWRRWHITLSNFLRDYIYIPLGGNKVAEQSILFNLMITFLIGGIWHGAGWTFVFWGFIHGLAMVVQRLWQKTNLTMHKYFCWLLTFLFLNFTWVFFRAETWDDALKVLKAMVGLSGAYLPSLILDKFSFLTVLFKPTGRLQYIGDGTVLGMLEVILFFAFLFIITLFYKNTNELKTNKLFVIFILTFAFSIQKLFFSQIPSEFLYFRF